MAAFKDLTTLIPPGWPAPASAVLGDLDFFTMDHDEIYSCFEQSRQDADVAVVEGNKGLFDGLDVEAVTGNAALAVVGLPVILVIDVTGITGIAPLLTGYTGFDPDVQIVGVILNRVAGPRQESKLRAAIERYSDLPVLGTIGRTSRLGIERHLGLVPGNEDPDALARIDRIANVVEKGVDLDAVLALTAHRQDSAATRSYAVSFVLEQG